MHSTNYRDTLITPSSDCPVAAGTVPDKPGSVAAVQFELLRDPYRLTSDDLLHAAHVARGGDRDRAAFFAKPQACLRASPLVKRFGWGVHHDGDGRVALLGVEREGYRRLVDDPAVKKVPGMRSKR
jgi:hypothetical protein